VIVSNIGLDILARIFGNDVATQWFIVAMNSLVFALQLAGFLIGAAAEDFFMKLGLMYILAIISPVIGIIVAMPISIRIFL
jgi:hypothetical protein